MKYILALFLFSLLFGCRTDKKLETGGLNVTGQYCKYPDNDFLILPFQLFRNEEHVESGTIRFSRAAKLENLTYGKYKIKFKSIYESEENIEFEIKNNTQEIVLCIDKIDYLSSKKKLLIDQLKPNQSLKIDFEASGCFHFNNSALEIIRTDDIYLAKMDNTEIVLTTAQLELIREFEIELREIQSEEWCTTSHSYNLSIKDDSKTFELVDESCDWRGFDNLIKILDSKITTANKT